MNLEELKYEYVKANDSYLAICREMECLRVEMLVLSERFLAEQKRIIEKEQELTVIMEREVNERDAKRKEMMDRFKETLQPRAEPIPEPQTPEPTPLPQVPELEIKHEYVAEPTPPPQVLEPETKEQLELEQPQPKPVVEERRSTLTTEEYRGHVITLRRRVRGELKNCKLHLRVFYKARIYSRRGQPGGSVAFERTTFERARQEAHAIIDKTYAQET